MGADVHAYMEYTQSGEPDNLYWSCLMPNVGSRDYAMFGIMAGVRGDGPLFPLKGLPEGHMSYQVEEDLYLRIDDEAAAAGTDNYTDLATATSWAATGSTIVNNRHGKPWKVSHPDWHSHTWFTREEFAQIIAHYMFNASDWGPYGIEWDAVLAAMTALEERGARTRLILWFDN